MPYLGHIIHSYYCFVQNAAFSPCLPLCSYCVLFYIRHFPGRYYTCCKYTPVNGTVVAKLILMGKFAMCVSH